MRFLNSTNKSKQSAFTMAEAILVMTILGVIASVMITTLKPAEFKEKALAVLAQRRVGDIDQAMRNVLNSHSQDSTLRNLFKLNSTETFDFFDSPTLTEELFKEYLVTTRQGFDVDGDGSVNSRDVALIYYTKNMKIGDAVYAAHNGYGFAFVLKDGSNVIFTNKPATNTCLPKETEPCAVSSSLGSITIDTNGYKEQPNLLCKDIFILPLDENGIVYDMPCD